METKSEYVMWSDGVIVGFGKLDSVDTINDCAYVKDPVSVIFSVTPNPEGLGGKLTFEMTPWVFRALLKDESRNIWKVNPRYTFTQDNCFDDEFITRYEHSVKITGKPSEK